MHKIDNPINVPTDLGFTQVKSQVLSILEERMCTNANSLIEQTLTKCIEHSNDVWVNSYSSGCFSIFRCLLDQGKCTISIVGVLEINLLSDSFLEAIFSEELTNYFLIKKNSEEQIEKNTLKRKAIEKLSVGELAALLGGSS
jgi:hypothetical protein